MDIKTNNHWRPFLYGCELPDKVRADFDYIDADEIDGHDFIKYRGRYYDSGEFMRIDRATAPHPQRPNWEEWHGYQSDSFFSGILIRFSKDGEAYQIATYYS